MDVRAQILLSRSSFVLPLTRIRELGSGGRAGGVCCRWGWVSPGRERLSQIPLGMRRRNTAVGTYLVPGRDRCTVVLVVLGGISCEEIIVSWLWLTRRDHGVMVD